MVAAVNVYLLVWYARHGCSIFYWYKIMDMPLNQNWPSSLSREALWPQHGGRRSTREPRKVSGEFIVYIYTKNIICNMVCYLSLQNSESKYLRYYIFIFNMYIYIMILCAKFYNKIKYSSTILEFYSEKISKCGTDVPPLRRSAVNLQSTALTDAWIPIQYSSTYG